MGPSRNEYLVSELSFLFRYCVTIASASHRSIVSRSRAGKSGLDGTSAKTWVACSVVGIVAMEGEVSCRWNALRCHANVEIIAGSRQRKTRPQSEDGVTRGTTSLGPPLRT